MPAMKKKKRNSILRRPDSADEPGGEGTAGTMEKAVALPDYDKENQAAGSGSGTDSDASGPVTRKKTKNKRRVSFGAHIACKDMDTGHITNLKIPAPSFNSSTSIAVPNGSLGSGSLSSSNIPPQIQEMEMSMDDSSMGLNKTAMAEGSSDSIALSETSGDVMDLSLLAAPAVAAPRKSILPFSSASSENLTSVQDVRDTFQPDDTTDSLISATSAICPPGLTGKINFPMALKKKTADEELDALDDGAGVDAGFLASMRRVSRGKVVANRKTSLDCRTIQNIVDVINDDGDGDDDTLEDDMEMDATVKDAMALIDDNDIDVAPDLTSSGACMEPTLMTTGGSMMLTMAAPSFLANDDMMQMTLGKTMLGGKSAAAAIRPDQRAGAETTATARAGGEMELTLDDASLDSCGGSGKEESPPPPPQLSAVAVGDEMEMSADMSADDSVFLAGGGLGDISAISTKPDMEMTRMNGTKLHATRGSAAAAAAAAAKMNATTTSKFDMDLTRMNKSAATAGAKSVPPIEERKNSRRNTSRMEGAAFPSPPAPLVDAPVEDSLLSSTETSFRRGGRLRSKHSTVDANQTLETSHLSRKRTTPNVTADVSATSSSARTAIASSESSPPAAAPAAANATVSAANATVSAANATVSEPDLSLLQRTTRSRSRVDESVLTEARTVDVAADDRSALPCNASLQNSGLAGGKGKTSKVGKKLKAASATLTTFDNTGVDNDRGVKNGGATEATTTEVPSSVIEVVHSMAEVSLHEPSTTAPTLDAPVEDLKIPKEWNRSTSAENASSAAINVAVSSVSASSTIATGTSFSTAAGTSFSTAAGVSFSIGALSTTLSTVPSGYSTTASSSSATTSSSSTVNSSSTTSLSSTAAPAKFAPVSQSSHDHQLSHQTSQPSMIPAEAFWLNPQPSQSEPCQPSPQKKRSTGISDEEMPMMTFDVGGETVAHEAEDHLETSMAVIKDLSSLAALSFVDPQDALSNLLSECGIDVEAIDRKWNEEIVPLFERLASPDTTTLPQLDGDDSFKDMLLRSHLGEARYLSTTITFDAFKGDYFVKVARLTSLIEKIQSEDGKTPGFLHEWIDGDEEAKQVVERRVKRMFKLYESKGYKSKLDYLTRSDQAFLEHIENEREAVEKRRRDLRKTSSKIESLLAEGADAIRKQEAEIDKIAAEREKSASVAELRAKLEAIEKTRLEEEEELKKRKESDAELKKRAKEAEEKRKERERRKKCTAAAKERIAAVKEQLAVYDDRDRHPWLLENYHLAPAGFFFFRLPRWKCTYDVTLGASTPSDTAAFEVASTRLSCRGVQGEPAALTGANFNFEDLSTRLPLMLHHSNYGEESQRMWTFSDLKTRLTDIVSLLDSCAKLGDVYDRICGPRLGSKRKYWKGITRFCTNDGKLYLAVCVRRGFLGDWPLALVVKFLLTPTSENHAHSFYSPPFDSRISFFNWTDWATHKINVADHKAAVLKAIKIEEASDFHSYLSVPFPPFHQFILAALSQTEILLDEKYIELFGDRSEISLGITQ